jgi:hypothetical protein
MPRLACHACGKTQYDSYQCDKCGKVLCSQCKGSYSICHQSSNGTPNCSGTLKHKG